MNSVRKSAKKRPRAGVREQDGAALAAARERPAFPKCNQQCERYAVCRPDSPGWISKKQVAANLETTRSALRMRAARVGYVAPFRTAMPRTDQPLLCTNAVYYPQRAQTKRPRSVSRRAKPSAGTRR